MKEQVYWIEEFPFARGPAPPHLPEECEVAIIGGGLTGLSAALHLAKRGVRAVVFEQETIGWGASTRNAGMALTGLKLPPEKLVQKYGHDLARRFFSASREALAGLEALLAEEAIDCDLRRCGDLCAACKAAHFRSLIASQKFLREKFHHETRLVSPAEMNTELGTKIYCGGLIDPQSAGLNPAKLVAGLAAAARRRGAVIFEKAPVQACRPESSGFLLQTALGPLRAREIVAATNAYTPEFLSELRRRLIPVGSYIIVTERLAENLAAELLPANRMVYDTKNFLLYFRRTPDDRLLFGGRTSFTPLPAQQAAGILQQDMVRVFPQLRAARIDYVWHGSVAFAFDQMPHLGVHRGLHYAMGYAGHGVVMSTHFGECLARILCGEPCDSPFLKLSFPGRFFYRRRPWFLPLAGAYYKLRDKIA